VASPSLVALAWVLALASMTAVLLAVYRMEHSLRKGILASLLWGKAIAGIYYLLRIDVPLATLYVIKQGYVARAVTITAAEVIFLSFLVSFLTTLAWPEIQRELRLPRSLA
jgi:hypothetical protein